MQMLKAVACGAGALTLIVHFTINLTTISRSVFVLYPVFLLCFMSFWRFLVRWYKERHNFRRLEDRKKVLIIGFNLEGERLIREMMRDPHCPYQPLAIVDGDPAKMNKAMHRVSVVGTIEDIPKVANKFHIDIIFIALKNASAEEMSAIVKQCEAAEIQYRIIPNFLETVEKGSMLASIREVRLEDLLSREIYEVDIKEFQQFITGKRILVTGGGGSIGSELCRQIAQIHPEELLIIDQCEANLYHIDRELKACFPGVKIQIQLVDISDRGLLERSFQYYRPHIVFHAAAYKHVPILESQIMIAIKNNVIGSKNVADCSVKFGAEIFIQISSDKAVNPTNVMGMTKRAAELYCQQLNRVSSTKIITVRFGNVIGSTGSVVPLFTEQLKKGGPLTVTHPDIERYFMTIPEACRLILQAMTIGKGGEILVLDMGKPIKIKSLAEQMIRLSGKKIGEDIKIEYNGLRPGEKLWEELFYDKEKIHQTKHHKIFQTDAPAPNSEKITQAINAIIEACYGYDEPSMMDVLCDLVPEYL